MPAFQTMVERANRKFSRRNLKKRRAEHAAPGQSLAQLATANGIAVTEEEQAHLDSWPATLQEVIRVTIENALLSDPQLPIGFSWAPAFDYSVKVWEAHSTTTSAAAITIHLESPYPT